MVGKCETDNVCNSIGVQEGDICRPYLFRCSKKSTKKFSLSGKGALGANVFFTSEALADTGWTTEQQTAMETSVEKEKMMENLTGNDGKPLWRMRKL